MESITATAGAVVAAILAERLAPTASKVAEDALVGLFSDGAKDALRGFISAAGRARADRRGRLPTNHDVQKAIFTAHIGAMWDLVATLKARGESSPSLPPYAKKVGLWLKGRAADDTHLAVDDQSAVDVISSALSHQDAAAFLRAKLEAAAWSELSQAAADPPSQVVFIFKERWFDAFIAHLSRQIKENDPFRNYLQTWLLSDIQGVVGEVREASKRIGDRQQEAITELSSLTYTAGTTLAVVESISAKISRVNGVNSSHPLIIVDEDFPDFSLPSSMSPLPTFLEYRDGLVPSLAFDAEVEQRLQDCGRVFVHGAPSVGKSSLAFRLAAKEWQAGGAAHYLDVGAIEDGLTRRDVINVVMNRRGRNGLVIIDNAHRDEELAFGCWNAWKSEPGTAKLIMLAVRRSEDGERPSRLRGLGENAVTMLNQASDLVAVAKFLYRRTFGVSLEVPSEVGEAWRARFAGQLHAFSLAIQNSLRDLHVGNFTSLSMAGAHRWIRENWLADMTSTSDALSPELENLVCISRFAAQDLELSVPMGVLPFPETATLVRKLGLVVDVPEFPNWVRLAEPGWGQLILAASNRDAEDDEYLFASASRSLNLSLRLWRRLQQGGQADRLSALIDRLFGDQDFIDLVGRSAPSPILILVNRLTEMKRRDLVDRVWASLNAEHGFFGGRPFQPPLSVLGTLLKRFEGQRRDVSHLWRAVADRAGDGEALLLVTPLDHLAGFLDTADASLRSGNQGMSLSRGCSPAAAAIWRVLESRSDVLTSRFSREPIGKSLKLIDAARRHGRDADALWRLLLGSRDVSPAVLALERSDQITLFTKLAPDAKLARDVVVWAMSDAEAVVRRFENEPLTDVAGLIDRARANKIDLTDVGKILSIKGAAALTQSRFPITYAGLANLLKNLSGDNKSELLSQLPESSWQGLWESSPEGVAWVAMHCKSAGLVDRSLQLVQALIADSHPTNLSSHDQAALKLLCWVTAEGLDAGVPGAEARFRSAMSEPWISSYYANASPDPNALCDALRIACLRLPDNLQGQLDTPALRDRVREEIVYGERRFKSLINAVRLRGWCSMIASAINFDIVDRIGTPVVSWLVSTGLPHRDPDQGLGPHQLDLWVGLRAIAIHSRQGLKIDGSILKQTLALWEPLTAATFYGPRSQAFHEDMVRWLRSGIDNNKLSSLPFRTQSRD
ncbi:hypothetical protein [Brevundimonas sp.]|jgi:hypothetical protein|uniref:hypothetical protein n=1 Tax=Brevundimonas sp. TaxID=1871086 RepID=UPI002E10BD49|nr:hypothetical protein [Brevundimonas sp.]